MNVLDEKKEVFFLFCFPFFLFSCFFGHQGVRIGKQEEYMGEEEVGGQEGWVTR